MPARRITPFSPASLTNSSCCPANRMKLSATSRPSTTATAWGLMFRAWRNACRTSDTVRPARLASRAWTPYRTRTWSWVLAWPAVLVRVIPLI